MHRSFLLTLLAIGALSLSGCKCFQRQPVAPRTTVVPGTPGCPPGGMNLPPPPAPLGAGPAVRVVQPPPNFPPPGPPPGITPAPTGPPPVMPPTVTPLPPGTSSQLAPRLEPNWQPAEARPDGSRLAQAVPDPLLATPAPATPLDTRPLPSGPKLYPPDVTEKSTMEPPLLDEKTQLGKTPKVDEKRTASFPAGIAQFVPSIPGVTGVSNGLRPSINDGLDWLAKNRFKTVLHLRAPGEADGPDRTQVEKLGMTYVSLEIGPLGLTRERVDDFAKLVGDVARQPLFVYDRDGSLAGPLWYLYFRKVSGDNDERGRIRAGSLGLRPDRDGEHRRMWLAVQKYLEENP